MRKSQTQEGKKKFNSWIDFCTFAVIMKKSPAIILLISLVFSSFAVIAQDNAAKSAETPAQIKWYTFEQAVELAKKNPKKIFVDVYTFWCGWCKRMDATTFTHPVIIKYMNEKYYAVKLNAEQKEPITFDGHEFINPNPDVSRSVHQFAASLLDSRMSYPTTVYLDEKIQRLMVRPGYLTPQALEMTLKYYGEDRHQPVNWEDYQKNFVSEIK